MTPARAPVEVLQGAAPAAVRGIEADFDLLAKSGTAADFVGSCPARPRRRISPARGLNPDFPISEGEGPGLMQRCAAALLQHVAVRDDDALDVPRIQHPKY